MCWRGSPSCRRTGSTNSCRGTGRPLPLSGRPPETTTTGRSSRIQLAAVLGECLQQCRRARPQRYRSRQTVVDVLRVRSRGAHVRPHYHSQDERHRSAGLARRCVGADRRAAAEPAPRTPAVELEGRCRSAAGRLRRPLPADPAGFSSPRCSANAYNNAAERALRGIALGRRSWMFCGSDRAALMYGLITTAKMNGIDPQAWLADVLARIADLPQNRLHELLPWNWKAAAAQRQAA